MPLPDVGLRAVIDNMGGFMSSANKVDQAMGHLGGSAEKSAGRMGTLGKVATQAMGTAMGIVGYKAVSALTSGMGEAISVAGDFEGQMNILGVAARSSGTAMEDLRNASIAVGADTELVGISAAEAADALTNFYKAGLETGDVFEDLEGYLNEGISLTGALRSAVDLAAASELNLGQASEVVAISMATFGLEAKDAGRIADSFVGAADASIAEVEDLTAALAGFGPTAAQFGWSLEETNQALAVLSTRGIAGSEAGTALRAMMTNLNRDVDDVVEVLQDLNVDLYDSEGNMYSLRNIVEQLSGAMSGLTEEQQNAAIQTLAGTYGMKAMATLLEEGTEGWDAMGTAINEAATAQEVAAARTKGWNAAMEQFHGAIETLMIKVGTPLIEKFLTPAIMKLTDFIGILVMGGPTIARWGDWLRKVAGVGAAVLKPIIELSKAFMGLVGIGSSLGGIGGGISSAFGSFLDVLQNLSQYFRAVLEDGDYLNDWLTHLPESIQGVVQALGRFIDVFQNLGQYFRVVFEDGDYLNDWLTHLPALIRKPVEMFGQFLSILQDLGRYIGAVLEDGDYLNDWLTHLPESIQGVVEALGRFLGGISTEWFSEHLGSLLGMAQTAWREIGETYGFGDTDILGRVQEKLDPVTTWWDEHHAGLAETARKTWDDDITPKLETAGEKVGGLLERIQTDFPEMGTVVKTAGVVIGAALLTQMLGPIGAVFAVVKVGKKAWDEDWFGIQQRVAMVASTFGINIDEMKAKALELWEGAGANLIKFKDDAVAKLGTLWDSTFGNMAAAWDTFWTAFSPTFEQMQEYLSWWVGDELLPRLEELHAALSETLKDHLAPAIEDVTAEVQAFIEEHPEVAEFLKEAVKLAAELAGGTALLLLQGALKTVTGLIDAMVIALKIANPIIDAMALAIRLAIGAVDGLISSVSWMWTRIQEAWNWVSSHTFSIRVNWPSVPSWLSWLVPGSLPPIAEGVQAINLELTRTVDILGRLGAGVTAPYVSAPAGAALLQSGPTVTHQWAPVVNANYVDTQSPVAISDDLEALAIAMRMMS